MYKSHNNEVLALIASMFLALAGTPSLAENGGPATVGTPIADALADTVPTLPAAPMADIPAAPAAVEIDYLSNVKALLNMAADACNEEMDAAPYDTKEDGIASCRAKKNIADAYWNAVFQKSVAAIGTDEAGDMTELANAEDLRDKARLEAAKAANNLAAVVSTAKLDAAQAINALEVITAEGILDAILTKKAHEAAKSDAEPVAEEAGPTIMSKIQALQDTVVNLADKVNLTIARQDRICELNDKASWCQVN